MHCRTLDRTIMALKITFIQNRYLILKFIEIYIIQYCQRVGFMNEFIATNNFRTIEILSGALMIDILRVVVISLEVVFSALLRNIVFGWSCEF